ncbi:MAG: hypothetical protein CMN34_01730 [Saprospirales bacterium]|nr:hypothetical protein [Saprospirales bacterium]|tara:strand:+ start:265 stop:1185 length:921 start_codon:yes stop_codon:yes gene_type:complete
MCFLLGSCVVPPRYITERYIKNHIEQHTVGEQSEIKMWWIFDNQVEGDNTYTEFVGYEYNGERGLVIGAEWLSSTRDQFLGDNTIAIDYHFVELDLKECQSILDNYNILLNKSKSTKAGKNEFVYHDYTVNEDLVISFRAKGKGMGASSSASQYTVIIDFWIRGDKYLVDGKNLVKNLREFMSYSAASASQESSEDNDLSLQTEFNSILDSLLDVRLQLEAKLSNKSSFLNDEWAFLVDQMVSNSSNTKMKAQNSLTEWFDYKPVTTDDIRNITYDGFDQNKTSWIGFLMNKMIEFETELLNNLDD